LNFDKTVSIVMPVYRGEHYIAESIKRVVNYMDKLGLNYEIIVVSDGSEDNTYGEALKASKNYGNKVKVYHYKKNKGKGYAFLYGAVRSRGNIVVLLDADLDIPPEQVGVLLKAMEKTNSDIVITDKWHPRSKVIATRFRRFTSKHFNILVMALLGSIGRVWE